MMRKMRLVGWCAGVVLMVACARGGGEWNVATPAIGIDPPSALSVMRRVADWQIAHPSRHALTDWTQGAYDAGLFALHNVSGDENYLRAMIAKGEATGWRPGARRYHADDQAVIQTYLDLYMIRGEDGMLGPSRARFDEILAAPPAGAFERPVDSRGWGDQWTWCDALFMAPPAWARMYAVTGETKYLDFMDQEWWKTVEAFYDRDEHLFFRDKSYIERRTPAGHKIFWSRGNGWVMGGLVRVLQYFPNDHSSRARYLDLYRAMAAKIASIQSADGLWRPNLLDPGALPVGESSGSGFYCYALAWGVNSGLLDRAAYLPVVERAWRGLVANVQEDGKLGYVQQIGAGPDTYTRDQTEVYGVGAFLLAGSEVYKCALLQGARSTRVVVENATTQPQSARTIDFDGEAVLRRLGGALPDRLLVLDTQTGLIAPHRWLAIPGAAPRLLFQTDLLAGQTKVFRIAARPASRTIRLDD
jgi:rhamnogalacturonyl hydrolase YesR